MGFFDIFKKQKMLKFKEERKNEFSQNKEYVLNYLKTRNVKDDKYLQFIMDNDFAFLKDNKIVVFNKEYNQNEEYMIENFLSCSNVAGRDIVQANKNLGLDDGDIVAVASVAGDDTICMNVKTNEICLYLIETGDMQFVHVADNFVEFCNMIKF